MLHGRGGIGAELYSTLERDSLPDAAVLASLGCGNPTAVADLREGDRVLDLGSGGGIDVLLSAKRVGPTGRAFGLDMTDEMLALAQRNAAEAGATNVEFLKGHIEAIPMPADSVDVVISNCVVNLAADKPAVFREIARVLRPGGRIGISDIVAEDSPDRGAAGGARVVRRLHRGRLSFSEFEAGLVAVGLSDVSVTPTHAVADGDAQRHHQGHQADVGTTGHRDDAERGPQRRGCRLAAVVAAAAADTSDGPTASSRPPWTGRRWRSPSGAGCSWSWPVARGQRTLPGREADALEVPVTCATARR